MIQAGWKRLGFDSRPTRLLSLCSVLLALVILGATVLVILETRTQEIDEAEHELMTLNLLLAEQTARAIQGVDLVLQGTIEDLRNDGVDSVDELWRLETGPDVFKRLQARAKDLPQIDAVTVIADGGRLVNFSRFYPIPPINVADRDYYQALKAAPSDRPFISVPVENRGTGTYTLYVARRFDDKAGHFIGLVLGAINLGYFEDLYRSLELGPGAGVSLWRGDGTLLARYPSIGSVGKIFPLKSFTETLINADSGVYHVENSIDGQRRIVATRRLRDYPMVVNVTRTIDQVLADWRHFSMIIAAAGVLCMLATALVARTLLRQFNAFERLNLALSEKAEAVLAREKAESELLQVQKLEAVGKLTTGIAHDFNNLLTTIVGNLSLLQQDADDARSRQRIAAIDKAVDRASTLTGQLLAFSRKQHLFPEAVDLNSLVRDMREMLQSSLGGKMRLELRLGPDLWHARVDRVQIELVLLNLAINARDAMPGGGLLTITTGNVSMGPPAVPSDPPAGDHVFVAVADTGTGMSESVLARAFDPFFTTKPVGQGTGLGLSQVHGTVHQSGGGIRIETALGRGTVVTLYLPAILEPVLMPAPAVLQPEPAEAAEAPARVLVVDDDGPVRQALAEMLEGLGHPVVQAESGAGALEILGDDPAIDLVVMDFAMPEMNGAQAAAQARALRPGLPILFVTGYAEVETLEGERSILQKPFRRHELEAKLHTALGR